MQEIKNILEQLRKMKTQVIIILLIAFILFYYKALITDVVEDNVKTDEIKHDIKNSILIHQMLNDLMFRYKADRGYIFRFHNGIMYYDGTHKNHQSLAYEVCNRGISSEAMQLQNLPTSLFPRFLQEIMLNRMFYSNINDIKENATRIALHEQGIKSVVACPVFKNGQFTAYIGLDFVKDSIHEDFNYHEFKQQTNEIGNILNQ
jgi:hypothetical protein